MSARRSFGRWITARKIVQITTLLIVIALLIMTRRGGWPPEVVNLIMRLDPLAVLAQALSSRSFLFGSMVVLLTVLLTVIAGRAWCGWLCPLGTVLDLIPLRKRTLRDKQPNLPHSWRSVKYGLLIVILDCGAARQPDAADLRSADDLHPHVHHGLVACHRSDRDRDRDGVVSRAVSV